jgi:hypothetical protein
MKPRHPPILLIEWQDAVSDYEGWQSVEGYDRIKLSNKGKMWAVGFIIHEDRDGVIICMNHAQDHSQHDTQFFIPIGCSLSFTPLVPSRKKCKAEKPLGEFPVTTA